MTGTRYGFPDWQTPVNVVGQTLYENPDLVTQAGVQVTLGPFAVADVPSVGILASTQGSDMQVGCRFAYLKSGGGPGIGATFDVLGNDQLGWQVPTMAPYVVVDVITKQADDVSILVNGITSGGSPAGSRFPGSLVEFYNWPLAANTTQVFQLLPYSGLCHYHFRCPTAGATGAIELRCRDYAGNYVSQITHDTDLSVEDNRLISIPPRIVEYRITNTSAGAVVVHGAVTPA